VEDREVIRDRGVAPLAGRKTTPHYPVIFSQRVRACRRTTLEAYVPKLPRDGGRLRKLALSYPEAHEDMPWGHHAIKVKGKSFVFLAADEATFSLSAKLPSSAGVAVKLPFASPTEYGLGKSGWVTARFPRSAKIPVKLLELWIDESYRAIAPRKLVAQLPDE
jgi:predicted DNA-binding protein (MmcQ/YjbR family)